MAKIKSARLADPATWRMVVAASRPVSWINTAYPFAAAYLVTGGHFDWLLVVGTFFFLVPYNIALYGINDVFDYESDLRNPRKGGLEGSVLHPRFHRALLMASVVTTVPFLAVLFQAGTAASNAWLLLAVFTVIAYSAKGLRFKERPVLDSLTSSSHFVLPACIGATLTGLGLPHGFWWAMGAFFCWGAASHALGAVQDVGADRAAGIHSIATALGARLTTRLAVVFYAVAALLVLLIPHTTWVIALCGLGYVANSARWWNISDPDSARSHSAWRIFLWLNYLTGAVVTITLVAAAA